MKEKLPKANISVEAWRLKGQEGSTPSTNIEKMAILANSEKKRGIPHELLAGDTISSFNKKKEESANKTQTEDKRIADLVKELKIYHENQSASSGQLTKLEAENITNSATLEDIKKEAEEKEMERRQNLAESKNLFGKIKTRIGNFFSKTISRMKDDDKKYILNQKIEIGQKEITELKSELGRIDKTIKNTHLVLGGSLNRKNYPDSYNDIPADYLGRVDHSLINIDKSKLN